ncbi:hypothetical protein AB1484_24970 [Parafrankia sp. FMc6]|uniref:hypothetical protein n=1 Tax=Parafrankia soli TaxID=2599596 RepID=UPI0034D4944B
MTVFPTRTPGSGAGTSSPWATCLLLFVLAGTVVRLFSVPAALGMMAVAMVIPPAAVISVSRPPHR